MSVLRTIALGLLAVTAATGCGAAKVNGTNGRQIRDVNAAAMPASLLGLTVNQENIRSTIVKGADTYVRAAGLFSMRSKDIVEATLEVARLTSAADDSNPKFRLTLASQVGGSTPDSARVGDTTVYFTNATKQRVFVWFRPRAFYVLSVRDDYTQPRGLLRSVMGLQV